MVRVATQSIHNLWIDSNALFHILPHTQMGFFLYNYYPSYSYICFINWYRLLLMLLIWKGPKWISRGFLWLTLKLTLRGFPRRRNCWMLWRKLVRTVNCEWTWIIFAGQCCVFFFNNNCEFVLADVKKKWESSSWGRKLIVQKRRQNLTDFDRFKLMLAKIKVGHLSQLVMIDIIGLVICRAISF